MRSARPYLLAALLVTLQACGDSFGPDTLTGGYTLSSLDGDAAPLVITEGPSSRLIMDGTLEVLATTWKVDQLIRQVTFSTGDTTVVSTTQLAVGSWSGTAPEALTFTGTSSSGGNFSGSGKYDGATRTLRLSISGSALGSVFVFTKD